MATKESTLRLQFFDYLFGSEDGYLCIATGTPSDNGTKQTINQSFFKWPTQRADAGMFIDGVKKKNLYFGVNLFDAPERTKVHVKPGNKIWADLDTCNPDNVEPKAQVVIETSPDRFQAIWIVDDLLEPTLAEEYSRRIYKKHKPNGVDSGWERNKLLRIPFTYNFKYGSTPRVLLHRAEDDLINVSKFEELVIEELTEITDEEMPDLLELPSAEAVIYSYRHLLKNSNFKTAYFNEPSKTDDWSKQLWSLLNICFEASMSREEAFVIGATAKCNKYERDRRPIRHLWLDVVKASTVNKAFSVITGDLDDENIDFPELINDDERTLIEPSFIDTYINWATEVTDANKEFHELCGAVLLSALLADKIYLATQSNPMVIPNLWGLVLGESSLTRKTTAMDMAVDFIMEHDPSIILATLDSSVEGMFSALSQRSAKVSMYYRDEVAGFFHALTNKSYLAGMPETLTKLYDAPAVLTRQLRKETITVNKPIFIFLGGGIKERVFETVDQEMFFSGFMPRFLVVSGEVNLDKIRWIGPPKHTASNNPRDIIRTALGDFIEIYQSVSIKQKILGQETTIQKNIEVEMTESAWLKMMEVEQKLVLSANESHLSLVALPTFTRLSQSLLKLAMLISATRQEPIDHKITVELRDLLHATNMIQGWSKHTVELMSNVGKTSTEVEVQRILKYIVQNPGQPRADIMRRYHLHALNAKAIFQTLDERGLITMKQSGRGYRIYPT